MYASIANVMLGRLADAEEQIEVGLRAAPQTRADLPLAGEMLKINRVMAAAYGGRHVRSLELGRAGHRAAVEAGAIEVASMWGMNLAECQMLAGDIGDARRNMLAALAVVRLGDPFSVRGIDAGIASVLCSWLGRHDEARELRKEIVDHGLARDVRSRIQLERATVWVDWLDSGANAAALAAQVAGDRAASDTHLVWAAWLYHDAVRLGRSDLVANRLTTLAQSIEGDLVPCMADHAEAMNARDGGALNRVSARFERLDSVLFAAEAAAQAHDAHLRDGEPQLARIAAGRAAILASRCPGVRTPPLADATAVPLTARELDVARVAATGLSSREIGERLRISVRTVDNHLGAVYGKLGANGRADLSALFGPSALLVADGEPRTSTAPVSTD
jgi:DNA-binding CsgD family transcriptional regulator